MPERREYMRQYWENSDVISKNKEPWVNESLYKSCGQLGMSYEKRLVSVSLDLPDSVLIEHFKEYLHTLRAESGTKEYAKIYKRHNFNDWLDLSVLPFIDLKIWEEEINIPITNRVIADAIFSYGEGGEEIVRKTVRPLCEWLLDFNSLNILAARAATQITGRNKKKIPEENAM
jgi:hypothetical protein